MLILIVDVVNHLDKKRFKNSPIILNFSSTNKLVFVNNTIPIFFFRN